MCGIFGAVFVSNPSEVDADAALEAMRSRGPDASLVRRVDNDATLGFVRLAILDLTPAGMQPMASADDRVVVVFNGEIYNHHELRRDLVALGHTFRSRSDTEVIVEGYRAWGDGIIERLDGMFAVGIYDRDRGRLVLARDRTGKKPLFLTREGPRGVRFASQIRALIASGTTAAMDETSLPILLAMGYVPAPCTMYKHVTQLAPAEIMTIEADGATATRRYWRAPFADAPLTDSVETVSARLRELFDAAVVRRLEADVPMGAFLSGGVDSTLIVGTMARELERRGGARVKTFSIGFSGDARFDETEYARLAATTFGTDHTEFRVEPSSFDAIEALVQMHDGPFGDSSALPTSLVSRLTREHVTVALTGDGGDELFCGYSRFLAAEAAERLPASLRALGEQVARVLPHGNGMKSRRTRAKRFLSKAALPLADRLTAWAGYFPFELDALLRKDVAIDWDIDEPLRWNRSIVDRAHALGASPLARILEHNFETYLPYDLLVKADRSSMLHSLELRSPFLDTALVEYAARIPDNQKRRGVVGKWILKYAFRDRIPEQISKRGKMGFGVPLGAWFRTDLQMYVREHFADGARIYQWLEQGFVKGMLEEHFAGTADHGQRIWLLLTLEIWLRGLNH